MFLHEVVRLTFSTLHKRRSELELRALESCGLGLRVAGSPRIDARGSVRLGSNVTLICEPEPIWLIAEPGATLEIGDGVEIGPGSVLASEHHIKIGNGARLGAGCRLLDVGANAARGIVVGEGARVFADTTLVAGSVVLARAAALPSATNGRHEAAAPSVATETVSVADARPAARAVLAKIVPSLAFAPEAGRVRDQAGWDSLSSIHALVALETAYGVGLPSDYFHRCETLEAIASDLAQRTSRA